MISEIFPGSSSPTCIRFWYYMKAQFNFDFGTLSVIKFNYENQTNITLWSLNYGQGANWFEAKISYSDLGSHSIIFQATKGTIYTADIAIDDISFFHRLIVIQQLLQLHQHSHHRELFLN